MESNSTCLLALITTSKLHDQTLAPSHPCCSDPCTTANNDQQGYPTIHWLPDSRLPLDPFWLKLGVGSLLTRSLVSRVRLLERSVTKRTPINAICSETDNDVFTLNVQGQLVDLSAGSVSSDQTTIQEQILADTTSQTQDSQATAFVCIDGDSTNMWGLCIAPEVCHSTLLDTSGFFKDPTCSLSNTALLKKDLLFILVQ
ncbi:hypothetical protein BASA62_005667 [Batrachochytrium salamandrivorans]|nr:hypothetical protein BASA62_005667 [Batrachochytrium salamandrivorans]